MLPECFYEWYLTLTETRPYLTDNDSIDNTKVHKILSDTVRNTGYTRLVLDSNYVQPTIGWLNYTLLKFNRYLKRIDLNSYSERNDCEDYAFRFWDQVKTYYNKEDTNTQGIAVGVLLYNTALSMGHAINFAIINNQMVFIDPQSFTTVELSDSDLANIWGVIM